MDVAFAVERREHLAAEARALLEHRLRGVEAGLVEAGQARDRLEVGELLHAEQHVLDGGDVAHGSPLTGSGASAALAARKSPSTDRSVDGLARAADSSERLDELGDGGEQVLDSRP